MNQHDFMTFEFNSSPLSAAYMHQWIGTDRIGTDNDLSPIRRQAIISNNTGLLLIGPWGTNFSKILKTKYETFINENASENIVCEMAVILSPGRLVEINFCGISYMQKVPLSEVPSRHISIPFNSGASKCTSNMLSIIENTQYESVVLVLPCSHPGCHISYHYILGMICNVVFNLQKNLS